MSVSVGAAIAAAFRIGRRHKKAVASLYLLNLLVALTLLPAFSGSFERSLGSGDYRQKMIQELDLEWVAVFQSEAVSSLARTLTPMVMGVGPLADHLQRILDWSAADLPWSLLAPLFLFWLLNCLLSGAALGSAALDPAGCSWHEFLRTGADLWARFLRLGVLSLGSFWAVHRFLLTPISGLWVGWAVDWNDARVQFWADLSAYAVALLAFGSLHLIFSFSRLIVAAEDRRSVVLALFSAIWFCWKKSRAVLLLALWLLLPPAAWIALRIWLAGQFTGGESRSGTVGLFLFSQLSLIAWMGWRFWFQLAGMQLFRGTRRYSEVEDSADPAAAGEAVSAGSQPGS